MSHWKETLLYAINQGRKKSVLKFIKDYPWIVDEDIVVNIKKVFGKDIVCNDVDCQKLDDFLSTGNRDLKQYSDLLFAAPIKNYPINYYEKLLEFCQRDYTAENIFLTNILIYGYRFTEGVLLQFLNKSKLSNHMKWVIKTKVENDHKKMALLLFEDECKIEF
jgi:hypothetical protein